MKLPDWGGLGVESEDENLFHLLDARRLIEVELAGRAAERRQIEGLLPARQALDAMLDSPTDGSHEQYVNHDIRFHLEIAHLAGNSVLLGVVQALMRRIRPYLIEEAMSPQRRKSSDSTHSAVYAALVAADAEAARRTMHEHLSAAYDHLIHCVSAVPIGSAGSAGGRHPRRTPAGLGGVGE